MALLAVLKHSRQCCSASCIIGSGRLTSHRRGNKNRRQAFESCHAMTGAQPGVRGARRDLEPLQPVEQQERVLQHPHAPGRALQGDLAGRCNIAWVDWMCTFQSSQSQRTCSGLLCLRLYTPLLSTYHNRRTCCRQISRSMPAAAALSPGSWRRPSWQQVPRRPHTPTGLHRCQKRDRLTAVHWASILTGSISE